MANGTQCYRYVYRYRYGESCVEQRMQPQRNAGAKTHSRQPTLHFLCVTRPVISETKNEGSYVNPNRKNEAPGANNYLQLIAMSLERPLLLCVQYV